MSSADCDFKFLPAFEKDTLGKQALTFSLGVVPVIIFCQFIHDTKKPQTPSHFTKIPDKRFGVLIF